MFYFDTSTNPPSLQRVTAAPSAVPAVVHGSERLRLSQHQTQYTNGVAAAKQAGPKRSSSWFVEFVQAPEGGTVDLTRGSLGPQAPAQQHLLTQRGLQAWRQRMPSGCSSSGRKGSPPKCMRCSAAQTTRTAWCGACSCLMARAAWRRRCWCCWSQCLRTQWCWQCLQRQGLQSRCLMHYGIHGNIPSVRKAAFLDFQVHGMAGMAQNSTRVVL